MEGSMREGLCGKIYAVGEDILLSEGSGRSKSKNNSRAFSL